MRELTPFHDRVSTATGWILLFAILLVSAPAMAQESDFEMVQSFRSEYRGLQQQIDQADSASEIEQVGNSVDQFIQEYGEHRSLIDQALHPITFEEHEEELRSRWSSSRAKLRQIDTLHSRVETLQEELESFRGELSDREGEIASLQSDLNSSRSQVSDQSERVRQYREALRERDQFVARFLDDLLSQYEEHGPISPEEHAAVLQRMEEQPVDLLKTLLGEYVNRTNSSTELGVVDYLAMKAQYRFFNQWWRGSGEQLVNIFDGEAPVQSWQEITDLLANWNSAIESRVWVSIQSAFAEQGVQLDQVQDSESLYNSLRSYLEEVMRTARETNRSSELDRYNQFSSFWNGTVKNYWGEVLIPANVLNHEQISSIDELLVQWHKDAVPYTNIALLFLVIAVFFVIVLIITNVRTRVGYKQKIESLKKERGGSEG